MNRNAELVHKWIALDAVTSDADFSFDINEQVLCFKNGDPITSTRQNRVSVKDKDVTCNDCLCRMENDLSLELKSGKVIDVVLHKESPHIDMQVVFKGGFGGTQAAFGLTEDEAHSLASHVIMQADRARRARVDAARLAAGNVGQMW